jgi:hypothetical protein
MNNRPQRSRNRQRRRAQQNKRPAPLDVWRVPAPLPELEPIPPCDDAGALLRSLGDPPMNNGHVAGHYFNAVVERAAAVAGALALSADLLDQGDATER